MAQACLFVLYRCRSGLCPHCHPMKLIGSKVRTDKITFFFTHCIIYDLECHKLWSWGLPPSAWKGIVEIQRGGVFQSWWLVESPGSVTCWGATQGESYFFEADSWASGRQLGVLVWSSRDHVIILMPRCTKPFRYDIFVNLNRPRNWSVSFPPSPFRYDKDGWDFWRCLNSIQHPRRSKVLECIAAEQASMFFRWHFRFVPTCEHIDLCNCTWWYESCIHSPCQPRWLKKMFNILCFF